MFSVKSFGCLLVIFNSKFTYIPSRKKYYLCEINLRCFLFSVPAASPGRCAIQPRRGSFGYRWPRAPWPRAWHLWGHCAIPSSPTCASPFKFGCFYFPDFILRQAHWPIPKAQKSFSEEPEIHAQVQATSCDHVWRRWITPVARQQTRPFTSTIFFWTFTHWWEGK